MLTIFLALLLFFAPLSAVLADSGVEVHRIAGSNRYQTAVNISSSTFDKSDYAIIASGESFPDALIGGTLAVQLKAPILVVQKTSVAQELLLELKRLEVKTIYLLGGEGTISKGVESILAEEVSSVIRIAGADRYETAKMIGSVRHSIKSELTGSQIVGDLRSYTSATVFADALAAAPFVGQILLGPPPDVLIEPLILAQQNDDLLYYRVFGGQQSVPGESNNRISGANRYATAVEIAKLYPKELNKNIDTIILVDGTNYPDALAAAPLVGSKNAALLLTSPSSLSKETKLYIDQNKIKNVIVVGGENSVSNAVINELRGVKPESVVPTLYDVVRVVDGDTVIVRIEGKEERVRLIGIDTPESVHPDASLNSELGAIASAYTKRLLEGKKVSLELDVQDRDHYGRLLAYVYLDGIMVNKTLLTAGMAQISTYPPNVKYVEEFLALEKVARDENIGLWGDIKVEENPATTEPPKTEPSGPSGSPSASNFYGRTVAELDRDWSGQIKGNISTGTNSKNEKIYHIPGWPSYSATKIDTSKGERWFSTEREAIKAGWRPDQRYMRTVK